MYVMQALIGFMFMGVAIMLLGYRIKYFLMDDKFDSWWLPAEFVDVILWIVAIFILLSYRMIYLIVCIFAYVEKIVSYELF